MQGESSHSPAFVLFSLICQAVVFELGRGGQPEECGSFYASPFVGSEGVVKLGFRHHYYLPGTEKWAA